MAQSNVGHVPPGANGGGGRDVGGEDTVEIFGKLLRRSAPIGKAAEHGQMVIKVMGVATMDIIGFLQGGDMFRLKVKVLKQNGILQIFSVFAIQVTDESNGKEVGNEQKRRR